MPKVNAAVVHRVVPAIVVVIPDVLIINGPMEVVERIDPVPIIFAVRPVRTLVDTLYKFTRLTVSAAAVNEVVPKSSSPNVLVVVVLNVGTDAPLIKKSLGALSAVAPAVVPKKNDLVTLMVAWKQPVPEPNVPLLV